MIKYQILTADDVFTILTYCVVVPLIGILFELIIVNVVLFVKSYVYKVKTGKPVINPDSQKGNYDLYTRWRNRIRRNVFKQND